MVLPISQFSNFYVQQLDVRHRKESEKRRKSPQRETVRERERKEEKKRERRAATWGKKAEETDKNEKLFFPSRFAVITLLSRSYCVLYTSIY